MRNVQLSYKENSQFYSIYSEFEHICEVQSLTLVIIYIFNVYKHLFKHVRKHTARIYQSNIHILDLSRNIDVHKYVYMHYLSTFTLLTFLYLFLHLCLQPHLQACLHLFCMETFLFKRSYVTNKSQIGLPMHLNSTYLQVFYINC